MKSSKYFFSILITAVAFFVFSFKSSEVAIKNFSLKNIDNKIVSLSNYKDAKGFIIVFTCNKCPMAKLYTNRLNKINDKYKNKGVYLLAINSMDTLAYAEESFKLMQKKSKNDKLTVPYLQDKKQTVAKQFGATHTPQSFIIWKNKKNNYTIKYHGAIDDNATYPEKANNLLTNSLDELLAHKNVSNPKTESFGCKIFYRGEKQIH
ncbi:thioredoxin family protein [Flavobacterium sp.]|uniref:thioredoxin family protein n=1 Tax=Flavobacterium sp. TaxID=239 RepID=UPI0038FD16B1